MDFAPSETQIALQGMARNFARQEILPALEAPDGAPGFPAGLLEKGSRLGLRTLALPEEMGGGGADLLTLCFVGEELGWADLGVGATFAQDWSVTHALKHICGEDEFKEFAAEFAGDHLIHLTRAEISASLRPEDRPPYETNFREIPALAERAGDEWLVSGLAPRVMNGEDARRILLSVESSDDASRHAFFIDTEEGKKPGIARRFDSMGMRTCRDVSLSFENFPISEQRRIPSGAEAWARAAPAFLALPCSAALGTARRANELATAHARERVQGGRPIIEHQTVGFMLCENLIELGASRRALQAAAWAADSGEAHDPKEIYLARVFASEACERIARRSMEVWGGAGYMTEAPMERLVRDMTSFMHSGQMAHSLRARAMTML